MVPELPKIDPFLPCFLRCLEPPSAVPAKNGINLVPDVRRITSLVAQLC